MDKDKEEIRESFKAATETSSIVLNLRNKGFSDTRIQEMLDEWEGSESQKLLLQTLQEIKAKAYARMKVLIAKT